MKSFLTPDDLFAQIIFMRTIDSRTLLLVEGDTDCALLDSHIVDSCESVPAAGKSVALGAALIAHEQGVGGVIALIDRDWVGILESPVSAPNVFYTDAYDMESTLFLMDDVLVRITNSYCRRDLLRSVDPDSFQAPRIASTRAAAAVAAFRYAATVAGWGISVRDFPVHAILDLEGGSPGLTLLCRIACDKAKSVMDLETVRSVVERAYGEIGEDASKCSGHDLMKALSFVINRKFGGSISEANLASAFRAAVGCGDLAATQFFASISAWAERERRAVWSCAASRKPLQRVPAARTSHETVTRDCHKGSKVGSLDEVEPS